MVRAAENAAERSSGVRLSRLDQPARTRQQRASRAEEHYLCAATQYYLDPSQEGREHGLFLC